MKVAIVLIAVITVALAKPLDDSKNAQILRYENDNIGVDGYQFAFETSDGQARVEQAELKNAGTENEAISIRGLFSWIGDDGVQYSISFIADENGYQPEGAHLVRA